MLNIDKPAVLSNTTGGPFSGIGTSNSHLSPLTQRLKVDLTYWLKFVLATVPGAVVHWIYGHLNDSKHRARELLQLQS